MKWIGVEVQPLPKGRAVLAFGDEHIDIVFFDDRLSEHVSQYDGIGFEQISHWMELPELPKEYRLANAYIL